MANPNVPSYLNRELIERSLANKHPKEGVVVDKFTITPATSAGDNYLSDVYRIVVEYRLSPQSKTTEHISLVVKCVTAEGSRKSVVEELAVYEKEATMFVDVLPELSKLANNEFFSARCYYATRAPERMLVLHDLKSLGYAMANRHAGFDFDHCALIMKKVGKLHAASMPFAERNLDMMANHFNFNMFNPALESPTDCIGIILEGGFRTLISVAEENWSGFDPKILAKMKQLLPVYVTKLEACLNQKFDDGFKVLNHGDLWCNNMLFKYEEGEGCVTDVALVDYQLSYYSSPGIDLNYALANCPDLKTRDRVGELVGVYHKSLTETLKSIDYPNIPTLADVQREIERMEFFALVSVMSILPIVLMEKSDSFEPSFDAMMDEELAEKGRKIQYNGKAYQAIVKPMLKRFYDKKLLDV